MNHHSDSAFILKGKPGNLLGINLISIAFSAFFLWVFGRLPQYENIFFYGMPFIIVWLVWELFKWKKNGIRELHISESGFKVIRGQNNITETISKNDQ